MLFFKSKDIISKNTVRINAVYRRKCDGFAVVVCGISRPASKSAIDQSNRYGTVVINNNTIESDAISVYFDQSNVSHTEFIHPKQTLGSVVVIFKRCDLFNSAAESVTLADFLENHELVIGYTANGDMITDSMLENITINN